MRLVFWLLILNFYINLGAQTAEQFFEMARKAMPNTEKAAQYLSKAIYKDPKNALYYFTRAKVYINAGKQRLSDVARDLSKAVELDPDNPYPYCWGHSFLHLEKKIDVEDWMEKAFKKGPNEKVIQTMYWLNKISGYDHTITQNEIENINRYTNQEKTFDNIMLKAKLFQLQNKRNEAKLELKKLLDLTPEQIFKNFVIDEVFSPKGTPPFRSFSYVSIPGNSPITSKKYALMIRVFMEEEKYYKYENISLNSEIPHSMSPFLIKAYYKLGMFSRAVKNIPRAVKETKVGYIRSLLFQEVGAMYQRMGLYKEAAAYYKNILETDPRIEAAIEYVKCLCDDGQYDKALKFADNFKIKNVNKNDLLKILHCTFCSKIESNGSWTEHYEKIEKLGNSYVEIMTQLNRVRKISGFKYANTFNKLKSEPDSYPKIFALLYGQAQNALALKKFDEAKSWIKKAREISPEVIFHDYEDINILMKSGEVEQAEKKLDEYLKKCPLDHQALITKGLLLINRGKIKEAYQLFATLKNKKEGQFYQLVSLFCFGKFENVKKLTEKLIKQPEIDERIYVLHHLLNVKSKKAEADALIKTKSNKIRYGSYYSYVAHVTGNYNDQQWKKAQDFGPLHKAKYHFFKGFKAMDAGDNLKAREHFNKCLIPYSIDQAEYHMAKACLKLMKK